MNHSQYQHITDKDLLDKFYTNEDNKWLGILLQRYTLLLLGTCMKYLKNEEEAKDSVQQIFLKVIVEVKKYKIEYFKSWLYMVARNYCLMKLRDKNTIAPLEENISIPEEMLDNYELLNKEKTLVYIEKSIQELNEEQQKCVTLFYVNKKTYQEISDNTGFTLMQVKSYIQNGKRNLKILVTQKLNEKNEQY